MDSPPGRACWEAEVSSAAAMSTVSLKNIYKIYDNSVTAVSDFNLEIADKEFIVLVPLRL